MKNSGTAYLFQASLISVWWVLISVCDEFYLLFSFSEISRESYFALLVPDLLLLGVLSLVRAYKESRGLSLIILGAFSYATLFCINASFLGSDGFLPTATMVFGLVFNVYLCYPKFFNRNSVTESLLKNSFKTLIQVLSFWTLFLGVIPYLILFVSKSQIDVIDQPLTLYTGLILFLAFTLLGLSSAFFMVRNGKGTPLPMDATNYLVTAGPYNYIRNPMAVAGVGQIIAISIVFSSVHVAIYSLIGGLAWHFVVRPIEETDLVQKFGSAYLEYKARTRCWIPQKKRLL